MPPTAKSFLLDLLSTLRRGSMPVAALVEAGAVVGVAENSIRVTLSRLRASGRIERDRRGRYRLGAAVRPLASHLTSWRQLDLRSRSWGGGWVGALEVGSGGEARRERLQADRLLRLLGFRPLAARLAVRPDNVKGGVASLRDELTALGLPASQRVFGLGELDAETEQRMRSLWDVAALRAEHCRLRSELEDSMGRLDQLSPTEAMAETFLLGGRAIRVLVADPILPEEIAPARDRMALLEAMTRYDRLGRSIWAGFLARFDVPHLRAPVDTRMAMAGVSRLAG